MKFVQKEENQLTITQAFWKVLVVDDDTDVHAMTCLALDNFEFAGRKLQIFKANSAIEAQNILRNEPNIAVALIDVIMETDDAGLKLVDFIRNELEYPLIRLIIRTGQPGLAPEKEVIERYDIDDYKDKTELTDVRLYTTMRVTLKSYHELCTLDANRKALSQILEAAPKLYHPQPINQFLNGVLTQIIGLCHLGETSLISTIKNSLAVTAKNDKVMVQAGTGRFDNPVQNLEAQKVISLYSEYILKIKSNEMVQNNAILLPLMVQNNPMGFIYLENGQHLTEEDRNLIQIVVNQCSQALENLHFYQSLKEENYKNSKMSMIAEQVRVMAESSNRAKSTFLIQMSHQLCIPLNAIIGYIDIIQEEAICDEHDDILPDLKNIKTAGKQLLAIITKILDISRQESKD